MLKCDISCSKIYFEKTTHRIQYFLNGDISKKRVHMILIHKSLLVKNCATYVSNESDLYAYIHGQFDGINLGRLYIFNDQV